ncbi:ubiquitin-protein ligase-like protein [Amylocarpus encephaloides]|uniref:Ubiquitin-protein ligase-like protein n=1 Tax=Amylocarpus encephaloides TaxID=45428 RepID=A0A9P8C3S9_9HELO|nr:ubiquitin-protein ligase-like protein [Amylocarpus encephaloides]
MAAHVFDNTTRFDIASWTANWTNFNATQFISSAKDLALAGPRMFLKLGSLLPVPEAVDLIFGVRLGQRIIPEATGVGAGVVEAVTTAAASARDVAQAATEILVEVDEDSIGLASRFTMEGARSIGNVFGYLTSRWAILCFFIALVLNRSIIYASTRRNLFLRWYLRLALRIGPIALLLVQIHTILQSIQCQTSPEFSMLRWGNATKHSDLMFTQNGGYLHMISSTLLGATDEQSCLAVNMIPPVEEAEKTHLVNEKPRVALTGSLSRLWPLFQTFCVSQVVESVSCAIQGRLIAAETGMTIFEHSLAFAEADAAIGNQLGFGSFGGTKVAKAYTNSTAGTGGDYQEIAITRKMILNRVNTAPEVLVIAFLSGMNHLTSHILAVFNLQGRLRLLNTGFWGMTFISSIVWSIWTFSLDDLPNQALLRYPTVCIVGFAPHLTVLLGIVCCMGIYGLALTLSALSPPTQEPNANNNGDEEAPPHPSFFRRLKDAHGNMEASVPLSSIRVSMHMDFYTALLKTGFSIMTMAAEAVYLNESRGVNVKERTWLEDDRLREIEAVGAQWLGPTFRLRDPDPSLGGTELLDNIGLVAAKDQPMDLLRESPSGYAREMTVHKTVNSSGHEKTIRDGVGAIERTGRWVMGLEFVLGITTLLLSCWASWTLKALGCAGIQSRPRVLVWLATRPTRHGKEKKRLDAHDPDTLNFWLLNIDGELTLPKDDHVDVEREMRNRLQNREGKWGDAQEEKLGGQLYKWWLSGGWWGVDDTSGEFGVEREEEDDDTTSVISSATETSVDEHEWESESDGRRTPTQHSPQASRESTPFTDTPLDAVDLAQLLNPKNPDQRADAQTLAAHLSSTNIVTRSRFKQIVARDRAQVLTSTLHRPTHLPRPNQKLTPEEEIQLLEYILITSRTTHNTSGNKTWSDGAQGLGEGGPQCVVCQTNPRAIIVWPCRCLSLCDDCRVTLAMNNFDKCVCCRRDVGSFSRIFVP